MSRNLNMAVVSDIQHAKSNWASASSCRRGTYILHSLRPCKLTQIILWSTSRSMKQRRLLSF